MVTRLTLDPQGQAEARDLAAQEKAQHQLRSNVDPNLARTRIGGSAFNSEDGGSNNLSVSRGTASSEDVVQVGDATYTWQELEQVGLIQRAADGNVTGMDPLVEAAIASNDEAKAEKTAEVEELSEVYQRGDAALEFISERVDEAARAEAGSEFIVTGDVTKIEGLAGPQAAADIIDAKVAFVDEALDDMNVTADLMALVLHDHPAGEELAVNARRAAFYGDHRVLRGIASNVQEHASKSDSLGKHLQDSGWPVYKADNGVWVGDTEQGTLDVYTIFKLGGFTNG